MDNIYFRGQIMIKFKSVLVPGTLSETEAKSVYTRHYDAQFNSIIPTWFQDNRTVWNYE